MNKKVDDSLLETIHSGWIGQGEKVKDFENLLRRRIGNPYCLSLSAGTHALHLALVLSGIEEGDEVITTALTCTATNWPILQQRAKIVWADIKEDDLNLDPFDVAKRITDKTKAIIVTHWGGYPCDLSAFKDIATNYGLILIEDAAHAFGASYRDSKIGKCDYSNFTMFSFQAIKHLTCGDGGALFTQSCLDYEDGKLLRWFGINREGPRRDMRCVEDIEKFGFKYHMNDINATIGISNFDSIDWILKRCRENVDYYRKELRIVHGITLIQERVDRVSTNWLFTVLVDDRTSFAHLMGSKEIAVSRVHERNDNYTCTKEFKTELPTLDKVASKMICVPCGWWVGKEEREYIVSAIKEGW
jgi:dTDP-4-amino-4,6-dideoxygalactose transaminase